MMHPKAWKILVSRELQYNLRDAKFEKLMFLRRRAKMFKNSFSVRSKKKKKKKKKEKLAKGNYLNFPAR